MEQFKTLNQNREYVISLQQEVGVKADGIYGPNTHKAVRAYYEMPLIMHMGKVVPIDSPAEINWSLPLYELDDGTKNWYKRKKNPETICVHWGGLNSRHCYNVFNLARGRHVSSHFLVGRNHKTNEYEILQCLDTGLVAYHAGKFNAPSIGVDICMHPDLKYWEKTKKWYPDASVEVCNVSDPRVQGKECVMIGDEFSEFCRGFLASLIEATDLRSKPVCENFDVMPNAEARKSSIVGHHNVSKKKWDIIPWAEKLYFGLEDELN